MHGLPGDKECLSAALDEAEDAKVDLPLLRRATVALRELRRKAAKVAKKGKSSRGDPAHRRSASPTRRRRSSRSASPGAGSRASDGAPRPTEAEGIPPFSQGSSESSGDFSIPAGKAGTTHAGGLDAKDAGGSPKAAGPAREADRGSPPLSSEPSMSLSQQSSLSAHSGAVPQPVAPPQPERQNSDRHAQHHGAGKGPHLVRDSVGELAAAVAMKVEALEKERERQREEKRQMRSKEAAERAAAAAQDKAGEVTNVRMNAKAEKAETGASTPKAAGRAVSFFGRKAAPVGTASPAGSGNGGDREWRCVPACCAAVSVPAPFCRSREAHLEPAFILHVWHTWSLHSYCKGGTRMLVGHGIDEVLTAVGQHQQVGRWQEGEASGGAYRAGYTTPSAQNACCCAHCATTPAHRHRPRYRKRKGVLTSRNSSFLLELSCACQSACLHCTLAVYYDIHRRLYPQMLCRASKWVFS